MKRSALLAVFLLVFLLGCGSTGPSSPPSTPPAPPPFNYTLDFSFDHSAFGTTAHFEGPAPHGDGVTLAPTAIEPGGRVVVALKFPFVHPVGKTSGTRTGLLLVFQRDTGTLPVGTYPITAKPPRSPAPTNYADLWEMNGAGALGLLYRSISGGEVRVTESSPSRVVGTMNLNMWMSRNHDRRVTVTGAFTATR